MRKVLLVAILLGMVEVILAFPGRDSLLYDDNAWYRWRQFSETRQGYGVKFTLPGTPAYLSLIKCAMWEPDNPPESPTTYQVRILDDNNGQPGDLIFERLDTAPPIKAWFETPIGVWLTEPDFYVFVHAVDFPTRNNQGYDQYDNAPSGTQWFYTGSQYQQDNYTGDIMIHAFVETHDVGCTQILTPTGEVDSGSAVTPSAEVRNYTEFAEDDVPVRFRIPGTDYEAVVNVDLEPFETEIVSMSLVSADWPRGNYTPHCATEHPRDAVSTNNEATGNFSIEVDNVGATEILAPVGEIDEGTVVTPQAKVKNFGTRTSFFDVFFEIGNIYGERVSLGLNPGEEQVVTFPDWEAVRGTYSTSCSTELTNDMVPSDDKTTGTVLVRFRDVGVERILAPVGIIRRNTVVTPKSLVKNYGNTTETFDVEFEIYRWGFIPVYQDERTITLSAGAETEVSFDNWLARRVGLYRTYSTTELVGDMNPENDAKTGRFWVRRRIGWLFAAGFPDAPSNKVAKGGAALTYDGDYYLYALKGNNTTDFYRFDADEETWTTLAPIPKGDKNKGVKIGGALAFNNGKVYALKGGNTKEFYVYDIATNEWTRLADIPGEKGVKAGGALVSFGSILYAFKGSGTNEFYSYNPETGIWEEKAPIPKGDENKGVKDGGALTTDGTLIYALKGGKTSAVYSYNPTSNAWTRIGDVPKGTEAKPVKAGGALTYLNGTIYVLKGNKTRSFYAYSIPTDAWQILEPIPLENDNKKVDKGGALTSDGFSIFAFKGNGSKALWIYTPTDEAEDNVVKPGEEGTLGTNQVLDEGPYLKLLGNPTKRLTVKYANNRPAPLSLNLYDISGRLVRVVYDSKGTELNPGTYTYPLDTSNLASGTYLLRIHSLDYRRTVKVVINR